MIVVSLDPIVFEIGPVQVTWTGLFVAIAIVTTVIAVKVQLDRRGFGRDLGLDLAIAILPGCLIGGRLFHIADYWSFYAVHPFAALTTGGSSLDGAVVVGTIFGFAYLRRRRASARDVLDTVAGPAALAMALGSIGSFLSGDAPGRAAAFGPAVTYLQTNQPGGQSIGTYPVALYEAFVFALIFAYLQWRMPTRTRSGKRLWLFFLTVGLERVAVGFLQAQPVDLAGLGQAQIVGVGLALLGMFALGIESRARGSPVQVSG